MSELEQADEEPLQHEWDDSEEPVSTFHAASLTFSAV